MPDESCRGCGGEITKHSLCAQCRQVIQKICVRCGRRTPEQVHGACFYQIEENQITMPRSTVA